MMSKPIFTGSGVALITPFNSDLTQEYLPNNNYFYLYKDENDFANIGVYKD